MIRTKALLALLALGMGATVLWPPVSGSAASTGEDRTTEELIARVDGIPITVAQAQARIDGIASVHDGGLDDGGWRSLILGSLIDDVVIAQEATRRRIEVTPADVEAGLAETRALFPDDATFASWLEERDLSESELRRRIGHQVLASRVFTAVTDGIEITDAELEAFYEEHPERFTAHDGLRPLIEVRPDLEIQLTREAKEAAFVDWLAQRRTQASVEVLHDDWS